MEILWNTYFDIHNKDGVPIFRNHAPDYGSHDHDRRRGCTPKDQIGLPSPHLKYNIYMVLLNSNGTPQKFPTDVKTLHNSIIKFISVKSSVHVDPKNLRLDNTYANMTLRFTTKQFKSRLFPIAIELLGSTRMDVHGPDGYPITSHRGDDHWLRGSVLPVELLKYFKKFGRLETSFE